MFGLFLLGLVIIATLAVPDEASILLAAIISASIVLSAAFLPVSAHHMVQYNPGSVAFLRAVCYLTAGLAASQIVGALASGTIVSPDVGIKCLGKTCYPLAFGLLLLLLAFPVAAYVKGGGVSRNPAPLGESCQPFTCRTHQTDRTVYEW